MPDLDPAAEQARKAFQKMADLQLLKPVATINLVPAADRITLNWNCQEDWGVTSVQRKGNNGFAEINARNPASRQSNFEDAGRQANQLYEYKLVVTGPNGVTRDFFIECRTL